MFDSYTRGKPEPIRVLPRQDMLAIFNGRASFEDGVSQLIGAASHSASECAVLYVALDGAALEDAAANRKTLGLIANMLRARVKSGALAYLGGGRFGVLLQGVSGRDAVAFCRDALSVLDGIRLHWQGEVLTVQAWIGGTMAEIHHDGMTLLEEAEHASCVAHAKLGRKLHMVHERQESSISVQEEDAMPGLDRSQRQGLLRRPACI